MDWIRRIAHRHGNAFYGRLVRLFMAASFACAVQSVGGVAVAQQLVTGGVSSRCISDATYICGVVNPEDLEVVPGGNWVIASGFTKGALYRISATGGEVRNLLATPLVVNWDRTNFGACDAPLDPASLIAHGIAIAADRAPRLFVVNHGGREAVEIFDVEPKSAQITWRGCILAPPGIHINSIAPLPGGRLAVTHFGTPTKQLVDDVLEGKPSGDVRIWSAKRGWSVTPGTAASGPNGLIAVRGGQALFVGLFGERRLMKIGLTPDGGVGTVSRSQPLDFYPDNLRWSRDRKIITTGMTLGKEAARACAFAANCFAPFAVVSIDPALLTPQPVFRHAGGAPFGMSTTALQVGSELWIGTLKGDRILRLPAPAPATPP